MQSVSSRIWTRVAVSISYDDNHYTTGTSIRDPYMSQIELFNPRQENISITLTNSYQGNVFMSVKKSSRIGKSVS